MALPPERADDDIHATYNEIVFLRLTRGDYNMLLSALGTILANKPAGHPLHALILSLHAQQADDTEPSDE